ncbi:hypothetical protein DICVIV_02216 [Dictyocaulus viviparus]|uniref:Uncharacterized protein n=1 Tax=Dictyocaulus viviparus TaxID=29172 RepID=A0A0D8Y3X0_DICVI|nr:hypothetical protein DICVIV_02216 [Dictyocaulus viviparus]
MSWESPSLQSWVLIKYVDIRSKEQHTLTYTDISGNVHGSTFSPYGTFASQQPMETHYETRGQDQRLTQEMQTQTDSFDVWAASAEQLQSELAWLLKNPSFQKLVEKMQNVIHSHYNSSS